MCVEEEEEEEEVEEELAARRGGLFWPWLGYVLVGEEGRGVVFVGVWMVSCVCNGWGGCVCI